MTIREDIHKHQWIGNTDSGYFCKLDLYIHCPEPNCPGSMVITEVFRQTSKRLVVTVACETCHHTAGLFIGVPSQEKA